MTAPNPQPRPCGDASPWAPLHGWRLWVAGVALLGFLASLPFVERAANDYRRAAAQGGSHE